MVPHKDLSWPSAFTNITNTSDVFEFIRLFADDTTIPYLHPNMENQINRMNEKLKEVTNWFKVNKLSVNASKTRYMILGTPHMVSNMDTFNVNVILDSTALARVKRTKFLGVLLDDCLTWKSHIDCVSKLIS